MTHSATAHWKRYRRAERFLRRLFPDLYLWRLQKLVALAVSYWERPDRYM